MLVHYERIMGMVPLGVPSNDPAGDTFNPKRYWRGPPWSNVNALIAIGLAEMHHITKAEELRKVTQSLIAEHGFFEYFDPYIGTPEGRDNFSWTVAISRSSSDRVMQAGAVSAIAVPTGASQIGLRPEHAAFVAPGQGS